MSSLEREGAGGRLRSAFGRLLPKGRKKPSLGPQEGLGYCGKDVFESRTHCFIPRHL